MQTSAYGKDDHPSTRGWLTKFRSLGSRAGPTKEVEVGYTTAFGEAMSSVRGRMPRKPFRLVFLSGMFATSDQNASLRWLDGPRKTKVESQTSKDRPCRA